MKPNYRTPSPELIAVKVPTELAKEIRRKARNDDRTVSGYLRRLLIDALYPQTDKEAEQADATSVRGR